MDFEWDDVKNSKNAARHGVAFEDIGRFDWSTSLTACDDRHDYGETRFVSLGLIDHRLHVCVYTQRQSARRIISLRKANKREEALYEEALETPDR